MVISNQEIRILEGLEKYQRNLDNARVRKERERRSREDDHSVSAMDRVRKWFEKNPGVVIRPLTAKDCLDIEGNYLTGFPRVSYAYFRKTVLKRLKEEGIIRYYWDSYRCCDIPGLYEYNDCITLHDNENLPEKGYHGLKWEIDNPRHQRVNRKGKDYNRDITQKELKRVLEENEIIKVHLAENNQDHTWTYQGDWNGRSVTFNIHNKRSNKIEIWLECSENPINLEQWMNITRDFHLIWGDIWVHSDVWLREIGINRDHKNRFLRDLKNVMEETARNYMVQIYQKRNNVRAEAHLWGLFDHHAQLKAEDQAHKDALSFQDNGLVIKLQEKVSNLESLMRNLVEDKLREQQEILNYQSIEMGKLSDNVGVLVGLLSPPKRKEEEHSTFVRADQLDPGPSYG